MTSKEKLSVKYPIVTAMKQDMKQIDCFNADHVKGFDRRVRNHDLMMFLIEYAQKLSDENIKLKSGHTATVEPEPVLASNKEEPEPVVVKKEPEPVVVKKEPEPVVVKKEPEPEKQEPVKLDKVEFKMTEYYDYDDDFTTDEEKISYYYKRCQEAQEMCERMYNNNYNCLEGKKGKNTCTLQDIYYDWCAEEVDELSCCLVNDLSDAARDNLESRHYTMLKTKLYRMTKHPE